jgi:2-dehydropantoate 2-reductase
LGGDDVTFIARGSNLRALQQRGIQLEMNDGSQTLVYRVRATDDYDAAGPQDLVILAVKAHQLGLVAGDATKLLGKNTTVVTMQNGIPYWYFHNHGGPLSGSTIQSVDPDGAITRAIPPEHVVGCVVYPATEVVAPGVVRHIEGDRLPIGELDGKVSLRTEGIAARFAAAGFKAPVLPDIRAEIWLKLWGNLTFNPISALTRATMADICKDQGTRRLATLMMSEAQAVANKLGINFRVDLERRIAGAERVGHHKTSMLQDVEAHRSLEVEALVGAVIELGRLASIKTPYIEAVYALTKLLEEATTKEHQVSQHKTLGCLEGHPIQMTERVSHERSASGATPNARIG